MASRTPSGSLAVTTASWLVALGLVLGATGCAPERPPIGAQEPGDDSTLPTTTRTPEVDDPGVPGIPVDISCAELVDDQTIYDWGSGNFALDPDYAPAAGSDAARATDYEGLSCGWINLSSGEELAVAVANLPPSLLAEVRSSLDAKSTAVADFGADGWFTADNGVGTAEVISGSHWIVATSSYFAVPTDASAIVSAATRIG